jgi:hypothetical protein
VLVAGHVGADDAQLAVVLLHARVNLATGVEARLHRRGEGEGTAADKCRGGDRSHESGSAGEALGALAHGVPFLRPRPSRLVNRPLPFFPVRR